MAICGSDSALAVRIIWIYFTILSETPYSFSLSKLNAVKSFLKSIKSLHCSRIYRRKQICSLHEFPLWKPACSSRRWQSTSDFRQLMITVQNTFAWYQQQCDSPPVVTVAKVFLWQWEDHSFSSFIGYLLLLLNAITALLILYPLHVSRPPPGCKKVNCCSSDFWWLWWLHW